MYLLENEKMITLRGTGNHRGSAAGKTEFLRRRPHRAHSPAGVPRREIARLEAAKEKSREQLLGYYRDLASYVGESGAWVFLLQLFLIDDKLFEELPRFYILEGKSADESLLLTLEYFTKRLSPGCGSFFREIRSDVCDVTERMLKNLDPEHDEAESDGDVILLAREPLPSEIYTRRASLLGLVCSASVEETSTAALLRALGIPAVYTADPFSESEEGKNAIIDSSSGCLYIDPNLSTVKDFSDGTKAQKKSKRQPFVFAEPDDLPDAKRLSAFDVDGIGPVASESLYLDRVSAPDEERLFEHYRELAESFVSKPVIIRALSCGGSVRLNRLVSDGESEDVELYVTEDRSLQSQLRAVMRASVFGEILFALPCTLSYEPLKEARKTMAEAADELVSEGHEFSPVRLGAIIDGYSQLVMCDKLLELCDFLVVRLGRLGRAEKNGNEIESDALALLLRKVSRSAKKAHKCAILSLDAPQDEEKLRELLQLGFSVITLPSEFLQI